MLCKKGEKGVWSLLGQRSVTRGRRGWRIYFLFDPYPLLKQRAVISTQGPAQALLGMNFTFRCCVINLKMDSALTLLYLSCGCVQTKPNILFSASFALYFLWRAKKEEKLWKRRNWYNFSSFKVSFWLICHFCNQKKQNLIFPLESQPAFECLSAFVSQLPVLSTPNNLKLAFFTRLSSFGTCPVGRIQTAE